MATAEQAVRPRSPGADQKPTLEIASKWEAGETGCGVLIVGLKREIRRIQAGELLQVTALDAGAAADIPAWCRLTGHTLTVAEHPIYVLKKRDD